MCLQFPSLPFSSCSRVLRLHFPSLSFSFLLFPSPCFSFLLFPYLLFPRRAATVTLKVFGVYTRGIPQAAHHYTKHMHLHITRAGTNVDFILFKTLLERGFSASKLHSFVCNMPCTEYRLGTSLWQYMINSTLLPVILTETHG